MKLKTYFKTLATIFLVPFLLSLSHANAERAGLNLTSGELAVINGFQCGYVNSKWIPGKIKSNALFYPLKSSLKKLKKAAKSAKSRDEQQKLNSKVASLKKRLGKGLKACKAASVLPTPTPTATPTLTVTATPTEIPPSAVTVAWTENATSLRGQNGSYYSYYCPANGPTGSVYGTNTYTDDSSICNAAVHMGLFTRGLGGYATIQIKEGQSYYYGDSRNGVTSSRYGSWSGSYIFVQYPSYAPIVVLPLNPMGWSESLTNLSSRIGETFEFTCSSNGSFGSVWGTDLYTADSSACTAAVHAGKISRVNGGAIKVLIQNGAASYTGSVRNGVTSQSYGTYSSSFSLVD